MKRVPKGTSAYQAAWIVDDYEDDGEDDDEDDDEDMDGEGGDDDEDELNGLVGGDEEEEMEEIEMDSRRSEVHRDLDPEQEEKE
jgi:pre-rRNA-processing protein TSR1